MNQRIYAVVFFLSFAGLMCAHEQTVVTASKLGYPDFITALRTKTERFLNMKKIYMDLNVQELHDQAKHVHAEKLEEWNEQDYIRVAEKIDRTFDSVTQEFLKGSLDLDNREASEKEQKDFITKLMKKAEEKITLLVSTQGPQSTNNDRLLTFKI